MAFFKRAEVWVLLLLSVVGVAWVLWSDSAHDRARSEPVEITEVAENSPDGTRLAIVDRRVSREQGHLVITLQIANATGRPLSEPLALDSPKVRLVTGDGSEVARFFLPFDPPPMLDPESGARAGLRYWFPLAQADEALWLEIDGERLAVKEAAAPGDPLAEWFPEGVEIAVNGLDWRR